jgi:ubiquinone/menaquinone biosynthesis C-methylase UbiE
MFELLKQFKRSLHYRKILKLVSHIDSGVVLDLSCASGIFLERLSHQTSNVIFSGIDISADEIDQAKKFFPIGNFSVGQAERLELDSNTFTTIFSTMSLHHYTDPEKVFSEIVRVLRSDGILYLTDLIPKQGIAQRLWNRYGCREKYYFGKYYTLHEIELLASQAGLMVVNEKKISIFPRIRIIIIKKTVLQ